MGYRILVDDAHRCVEIRFVEPAPYGEHVRARAEILDLCRARGIHKILVDASDIVLDDQTSVMQIYDFGTSWVEQLRDMRVTVAGVFPRDRAARERVMFGETVAINRGFDTQAFDSIEDARAWLWGSGK